MAEWTAGSIPVNCSHINLCKNYSCAYMNRSVNQHIWNASMGACEELDGGLGFAFTCYFIGGVKVEIRKKSDVAGGQCDSIW